MNNIIMTMEEHEQDLRGCPVKGHAYPVLVLGVGNPLMADDGIGIELLKRLRAHSFSPLVHLEDGGTLGMTLLPLLEDADALIMLDAVKTGAAPGSIIIRHKEELPGHFSHILSPHQIGMKEVLGAAQLCDTLPRTITLIGVEAENVSFGMHLSASVEAAIPEALKVIEQFIAEAVEHHA